MDTQKETQKKYVKHSTNTSDDKAPNGESWLDYWGKNSNCELPSICPCCKETSTEDNPLVGAHVDEWIASNKDNIPQHYITPTCDSCNKRYKYTKARKVFTVEVSYLVEIE